MALIRGLGGRAEGIGAEVRVIVRRSTRLIGVITIALWLAGCGAGGQQPEAVAPSTANPAAKARATWQWAPTGALDLMSPLGTYVRAVVQSLREYEDVGVGFPGFDYAAREGNLKPLETLTRGDSALFSAWVDEYLDANGVTSVDNALDFGKSKSDWERDVRESAK